MQWCLKLDLNQQPFPYEGAALPFELLRHLGCAAELESATFGATIRRSNQLSYAHMVLPAGVEHSLTGLKGRGRNRLSSAAYKGPATPQLPYCGTMARAKRFEHSSGGFGDRCFAS